jgi:hypothetical protein
MATTESALVPQAPVFAAIDREFFEGARSIAAVREIALEVTADPGDIALEIQTPSRTGRALQEPLIDNNSRQFLRNWACGFCPCSCIRAGAEVSDLDTIPPARPLTLEVVVGTPDGNEFKFKASDDQHILAIKQQIDSLHGISLFDQELLHPDAEEPLLNTTLLSSLETHVLYMIVDPVTGAVKAKKHAEAEAAKAQARARRIDTDRRNLQRSGNFWGDTMIKWWATYSLYLHFLLLLFVFLPMLAVKLDSPQRLHWLSVFAPVLFCTAVALIPMFFPCFGFVGVWRARRGYAAKHPDLAAAVLQRTVHTSPRHCTSCVSEKVGHIDRKCMILAFFLLLVNIQGE